MDDRLWARRPCIFPDQSLLPSPQESLADTVDLLNHPRRKTVRNDSVDGDGGEDRFYLDQSTTLGNERAMATYECSTDGLD